MGLSRLRFGQPFYQPADLKLRGLTLVFYMTKVRPRLFREKNGVTPVLLSIFCKLNILCEENTSRRFGTFVGAIVTRGLRLWSS